MILIAARSTLTAPFSGRLFHHANAALPTSQMLPDYLSICVKMTVVVVFVLAPSCIVES